MFGRFFGNLSPEPVTFDIFFDVLPRGDPSRKNTGHLRLPFQGGVFGFKIVEVKAQLFRAVQKTDRKNLSSPALSARYGARCKIDKAPSSLHCKSQNTFSCIL